MQGTTAFPLVCSALAAVLAPCPAAAQDSDTQAWLTLDTTLPISPKVDAVVDLAYRFRSAAAGSDQRVAIGLLDWKVRKNLSLGGGLSYYATDGQREFRTFEQIAVSSGPFTLRSRIEERMYEGGNRTGLRLRERLQYRLPLDRNDQLNLSAEALVTLRAAFIGKPTGLDQLRFTLAERHRFSPRLDLAIGYMALITSRPNAPDRLSHVPQLTIVWRP